MSEEKVELVRGRFAAALVGDWETALAALEPEIEIHDFDIPDAGGVYHGHEGYREWVKHWTEGWESTRMEAPEIRAVAGFAVAESCASSTSTIMRAHSKPRTRSAERR